VGFVGVLQDITDRKLADEKIRGNEIRFRAMIDSVKDYAIFMLDGAGRVISWNKGAERTAGFAAAEVLNQHFSIFFPIEDREAGRADEMLKNALAEGQCNELGWRMRADGARFWASVVVSAVDNDDGGLMGFSHVIRDLTDSQQAFEDLKLAKEQAEAANQAKTDFLANISHEIRTPMTGVIGMAGLLAETEMSPKQREYCEIVRRSSESLMTIINEILDFSKVESGQLEMEIINFDLRSAIEQVMDLFATQADHKGIELINFMRYDVPTALQGDPGRLRQILSNLVNNAIKFTARGEVVVRLNVVEQTPVIATLRFEVSDTGIGIPNDKLGGLFSRFTQVDASIRRQYGGTGLGLAICKKFVDLMNGQIGVESEPGKGSVFWFTVPLLKQPQPVQQPLKPRDDLSGLRVLVVDASETCRAVLGNYLEALGIVSEATDDAAATLELLETANTDGRPYDVAIIDYRLPQTTGLDLARTIRNDPKLGQLKILLLTSVGRRGDGDLARHAGIDAYLTKPVRFSLLSDCLALVTGDTGDYPSAMVTRHSVTELQMQKRLRLLVADDNHINQKVAVSLLERLGHRADVVNNGQEALDAFIMVPYDAVFMDLQMPQMDGFEASRHIRSQAEKTGRRTLIVAVTAHARTEDKRKCLAAGFDDYISKPIDPKELRVVIERILTSGASDATTAAVNEAAAAQEVLNFSEALSQVEGNQALLDEIVQMYQEQEPKLRDKIHRALADSNYEELADAAHTLASSAGQVGAARAQAAAKNLEHLGRQGELSGLHDALSELDAELERADYAICDQARLLRGPLDLPNSTR
jgi:PAS domain S-box-containing protein